MDGKHLSEVHRTWWEEDEIAAEGHLCGVVESYNQTRLEVDRRNRPWLSSNFFKVLDRDLE